MGSKKGYIWFDHAKIVGSGINTPDNSDNNSDSDSSVNSGASVRSVYDSEGRMNVDDEGWPFC